MKEDLDAVVELRVTVVGKDLFKIVEEKFKAIGVNTVSTVNSGMLGNLTVFTYILEIPKEDLIDKRGELMELMREDDMRLMPMYVHGDWLRIFVLRPIRG